MKENIKNRYFSSVRLSAYNSFDDYKSNLKISKEYYIPLSILEIGLRNAINDCFSIEFGENWINSDILHLDSIKKIEEVKYRILQEQKELNQNQVISELSFGFWTALFRNSYIKTMRTNIIKKIFPNLPTKDQKLITREYMNKKLNHIRKFRNRVFHYENILKEEFKNIEDDIYEILSYFDNELVDFTKKANNG